jgi:hypothetical protein
MALKNYTAPRLVSLFDRRWAALGDWRNRWQSISQYILPQQRSFTSHESPGNRRGENIIYDSTALEANERLATRMHEALTSPATIWFRLQFQDTELNKNDRAREWLDECERRMRDALRTSNFDMTMGQAYLDMGALGTSIIMAEEATPNYPDPDQDTEFNGLSFRPLHLGQVGVAESAAGAVDEVFATMDLTAEQWCQRFPDAAPERISDACEAGQPDKVFKALVCWFRRDLDAEPEGPLLPYERPWAEVWIDYGGKTIVEDGGTYEQAVYVMRWRKKSDDIMGYGPGERALPTVRTINEAQRLELAAWAKAIDPPIKTTGNNVIGDLNLRAKGLTVVRKMDEIEQWNLHPDFNHHMIALEDARYQVREIFRYHSLELPPREQTGEMTAYEVSKRVEQVYRALGPTVVQMQADGLNPLLQRVFGIMFRKNAFPPPPEGLPLAGLRVDYVGAMALAQRAIEIESIDRFVADALALAQSGRPDALDIVDFDKAQRYKASIMAVPALVTRSEQEVAAIRKARAQAEMQAAEQQRLMQHSEALKNLGSAVGQETMSAAVGNMADNAMQQ